MNESKNLLIVLGEWWARRQAQPKAMSRFTRWLPTPGNVIFTLLAIGLLIMTQNVWARPNLSNVPGPSATTVNYQGRLADSGGTQLDGTYNMSFAIYDAQTGGNLIWGPESHPAISVSEGLFNVGLGSQTPGGIPTTTWDGDRYLEITVDGETLSPREPIRSVPIAGMALTVPDGAITSAKIVDRAVTDIWYLAPTSAVSINPNTSWTNIADTSLTFSLDADAKVFLTYSINVQPDSNPSSDYLATRLVVDEVAYSSSGSQFQPFTSNTSNMNLNGNLVLDLAEGQHTVTLQWASPLNTTSWSNNPAWCGGQCGARTITALAFYK